MQSADSGLSRLGGTKFRRTAELIFTGAHLIILLILLILSKAFHLLRVVIVLHDRVSRASR